MESNLIANYTKWNGKKVFRDRWFLHRLIGSTVMLNTVCGAGGADGYIAKVAVRLELWQILQQQKSMKRQTNVALIMAPGEVKIQ